MVLKVDQDTNADSRSLLLFIFKNSDMGRSALVISSSGECHLEKKPLTLSYFQIHPEWCNKKAFSIKALDQSVQNGKSIKRHSLIRINRN